METKEKNTATPYDLDGKPPLKLAIPLGLQHVLAMFVGNLTPLLIITGACGLAGGEFAQLQLSLLQNAMLVAGIVTLVQLFSIGPVGGKVPIIMGTSSGFIGVFNSVAASMGGGVLAYGAIMGASIIGGIFESVLGFFLKPLRRFFPPVVTGPIIISIGLILAPSAITNCQSNWLLAFVALGTVIVCNIWGKGMVKILPILIGVLVSYAVALVTGAVDFQKISEAAWLGIPLHKEAMGLFAIDGSPEFISALFTIIPIALATMMEHVGDIAAISATVGHNYINDPGLNRTLMGDGLATTLAGLLGGRAAEEMMLGDISTGASSDIQRATAIARKMVGTYGMSSRLGNVAFDAGTDEVFIGKSMAHTRPYSEKTAAEMDAEIRAIIDEAYEKCREILARYKTELTAVAEYLLEHETMDGEVFKSYFTDHE